MKNKILLFIISSMIMLSSCGDSNEVSQFNSNKSNQANESVNEPITYGTDYDSTWGDLIAANGGKPVWGTLTKEQQNLVNYPYLDKEKVYYVPDGYSYHSVEWCYTLENSKTVLHCTLDEALDSGLTPCSKCVGD